MDNFLLESTIFEGQTFGAAALVQSMEEAVFSSPAFPEFLGWRVGALGVEGFMRELLATWKGGDVDQSRAYFYHPIGTVPLSALRSYSKEECAEIRTVFEKKGQLLSRGKLS